MVVDSFKPFWILVRDLWLLLPAAVYVLVIAWLDLQFHFEEFNFPAPIVTVLGTVIGLLLAFRCLHQISVLTLSSTQTILMRIILTALMFHSFS